MWPHSSQLLFAVGAAYEAQIQARINNNAAKMAAYGVPQAAMRVAALCKKPAVMARQPRIARVTGAAPTRLSARVGRQPQRPYAEAEVSSAEKVFRADEPPPLEEEPAVVVADNNTALALVPPAAAVARNTDAAGAELFQLDTLPRPIDSMMHATIVAKVNGKQSFPWCVPPVVGSTCALYSR